MLIEKYLSYLSRNYFRKITKKIRPLGKLLKIWQESIMDIEKDL
jgi:hypothetical protein